MKELLNNIADKFNLKTKPMYNVIKQVTANELVTNFNNKVANKLKLEGYSFGKISSNFISFKDLILTNESFPYHLYYFYLSSNNKLNLLIRKSKKRIGFDLSIPSDEFYYFDDVKGLIRETSIKDLNTFNDFLKTFRTNLKPKVEKETNEPSSEYVVHKFETIDFSQDYFKDIVNVEFEFILFKEIPNETGDFAEIAKIETDRMSFVIHLINESNQRTVSLDIGYLQP